MHELKDGESKGLPWLCHIGRNYYVLILLIVTVPRVQRPTFLTLFQSLKICEKLSLRPTKFYFGQNLA